MQGIAGVARHEHGDHAGTRCRQALGQFASAHLGHDHIGKQETDFARVPGAGQQGLLAIGRGQNRVTRRAQDPLDDLAERGLVFRHQYGSSSDG